MSPFSSSSGSHRRNEIFIICHRGDARWACHSGVNPCHIKTSAARQGPAPAQSPQRGGVVPAEDARHPWPHSPAPEGHRLFSHSATALPVTKSKPQARGVAHQMGSSSPSGRLWIDSGEAPRSGGCPSYALGHRMLGAFRINVMVNLLAFLKW